MLIEVWADVRRLLVFAFALFQVSRAELSISRFACKDTWNPTIAANAKTTVNSLCQLNLLLSFLETDANETSRVTTEVGGYQVTVDLLITSGFETLRVNSIHGVDYWTVASFTANTGIGRDNNGSFEVPLSNVQIRIPSLCGQTYLVARVQQDGGPSVKQCTPIQLQCLEKNVDLALLGETRETYDMYSHRPVLQTTGQSLSYFIPEFKLWVKNVIDNETFSSRTGPSAYTVSAYLKPQLWYMFQWFVGNDSIRTASHVEHNQLNYQLGDVLLHVGNRLVPSHGGRATPSMASGYQVALQLENLVLGSREVCGNGIMVVHLDVPHQPVDANPFNNYYILPIFVDCWGHNPVQAVETCQVVPNYYDGGQTAWITYTVPGQMKIFEYKSEERSVRPLNVDSESAILQDVALMKLTTGMQSDRLQEIGQCVDTVWGMSDTFVTSLDVLLNGIQKSWNEIKLENEVQQVEHSKIGLIVSVLSDLITLALQTKNPLHGWLHVPFHVAFSPEGRLWEDEHLATNQVSRKRRTVDEFEADDDDTIVVGVNGGNDDDDDDDEDDDSMDEYAYDVNSTVAPDGTIVKVVKRAVGNATVSNGLTATTMAAKGGTTSRPPTTTSRSSGVTARQIVVTTPTSAGRISSIRPVVTTPTSAGRISSIRPVVTTPTSAGRISSIRPVETTSPGVTTTRRPSGNSSAMVLQTATANGTTTTTRTTMAMTTGSSINSTESPTRASWISMAAASTIGYLSTLATKVTGEPATSKAGVIVQGSIVTTMPSSSSSSSSSPTPHSSGSTSGRFARMEEDTVTPTMRKTSNQYQSSQPTSRSGTSGVTTAAAATTTSGESSTRSSTTRSSSTLLSTTSHVTARATVGTGTSSSSENKETSRPTVMTTTSTAPNDEAYFGTKPSWHQDVSKIVYGIIKYDAQFLTPYLSSDRIQAISHFFQTLFYGRSEDLNKYLYIPTATLDKLSGLLKLVLSSSLPRIFDDIPEPIYQFVLRFYQNELIRTDASLTGCAFRKGLEMLSNVTDNMRKSKEWQGRGDQLALYSGILTALLEDDNPEYMDDLFSKIVSSSSAGQTWMIRDGVPIHEPDADDVCRRYTAAKVWQLRTEPVSKFAGRTVSPDHYKSVFWTEDRGTIYRGDRSDLTGQVFWSKVATCSCTGTGNYCGGSPASVLTSTTTAPVTTEVPLSSSSRWTSTAGTSASGPSTAGLSTTGRSTAGPSTAGPSATSSAVKATMTTPLIAAPVYRYHDEFLLPFTTDRPADRRDDGGDNDDDVENLEIHEDMLFSD